MIQYLRIEEIISYHDLLIEKYGGMPSIRDLGRLASAIAMPQQSFMGVEFHLSLYEKAAAYLFHIIKNRSFFDGNKRTGVFTALAFLQRNELTIEYDEQILEKIALSVANHQLNKTEVALMLASDLF